MAPILGFTGLSKFYSLQAVLQVLSLWTLFFLGLSAVNAQEQYRNLNVSHGMLNNQAWRVQSLDNRTLLVAYDNAFCIYDGACFQSCRYDFRKDYRLKSYSIGRTYQDKEHRVWIKNYSNLFCYDQQQGCFRYDIQNMLQQAGIPQPIENIFFDADSCLWALTQAGHVLYAPGFADESNENASSTQVYSLSEAEKKAGVSLIELAQAGNEILLFFSDGNVRIYNKHTHQLLSSIPNLRTEADARNNLYTEIVALPIDAHRTVVATHFKRGIMVYDARTHCFTTLKEGGQPFVKMLRDPQGRLLVFHIFGFDVFNSDLQLISTQKSFSTEKENFVTRDLLDATFDWQGGLWLASFRYGLFYTHRKQNRLSLLTMPDTDNQNIVGVVPCRDGVMAFTRKDAYTINETTGAIRHIYHSDEKNITNAVTLTNKDVAITTDRGLLLWTPNNTMEVFDSENVDNLPSDIMYFVVEVDGKLLVTTKSTGLGWLDHHTKSFQIIRSAKDDLYRELYYGYFDSKEHRVVIGARHGVMAYDLKTHQFMDVFNPDMSGGYSQNCNAYLRDNQGNEWFGTNNGLFMQAPGEAIKHFVSADGLPGNCIKDLKEGKNGQIWVLFANELARIEYSDGRLSVHGSSLNELLAGGEFSMRSLVVTNNTVYCGSSKGVVRVQLVQPLSSPHSSKIGAASVQEPLLTSMSIFGREVPIHQERTDSVRRYVDWQEHRITLRADENMATLHFSVCNYLYPMQSHYRYSLNNGKTWIESVGSDPNVILSQLSPATYTLQVCARQADGAWCSPVQWTIVVLSPWWQTWWMKIVYLLTIAVGLWFAHKVYKERHQLLTQLSNRRNQFLVQAEKVKPNEIKITPRDDEFLQKAVADVETHFSETDYGVESLANHMGMTRISLYRKLQSITGQAPIEFIRTIRLRRAEQLLRESGLNVEEVALRVGFNSARNLTHYFKEVYEMTPSEYKKKYSRG